MCKQGKMIGRKLEVWIFNSLATSRRNLPMNGNIMEMRKDCENNTHVT